MRIEAMRRAFGLTPFTTTEAALVLGIRKPYSTLQRWKEASVIERVGRGTYCFTPLGEPKVARYLEREMVRSTRARRENDLSTLAKSRWEAWLASGRLQKTGVRKYRFVPYAGGVTTRVRRR